MLGAHLAVQKRYEKARASFNTSSEFAANANDKKAKLMSEGWVILIDHLSAIDGADKKLETLKPEMIAQGEDGKFYAGQFDPLIKYVARDHSSD
tara:strand:- start:1448 stop:1729 length:282 start_codon:yes stop_codon:yes gene_type:complete